jgi:hypothetical protein
MAWKEASFESEPGKASRWILLVKSYWKESTIFALITMNLIAWTGTWDTGAKRTDVNERAVTILTVRCILLIICSWNRHFLQHNDSMENLHAV